MKSKEIKISLDIVKGALFSIIAVVLILATPSQVSIKWETEAINSRTFPYLIFGLMLICGILFALRGIRAKGSCEMVTINWETVKSLRNPMFFLAIMAAYIFLLSCLGYIISSMIAVIVVLAFLRCKNWYYYAIGIGMVFAVHYIFAIVIGVQLPSAPF